VALGRLASPMLNSRRYVKDMPTLFRNALALYAVDTGLVSTFPSPPLLVRYSETLLNSTVENWLQEWGIAVSVSKSTTVPFTKTIKCI
jgi:hypothetical protein